MADLLIPPGRFDYRKRCFGSPPRPPRPEQEGSAPAGGALKRKETPSWMS